MVDINDDQKAKAVALKQQGNVHFKAKEWDLAVDLYTQAINVNPDEAAFYSNRAFAYIKTESYGFALEDANQAIKRGYTKGLYRRGTAYLAMGQLKEALKDLRQIRKVFPHDQGASAKCKQCEKAIFQQRFSSSVAHQTDSQVQVERLKWQDIEIESSYQGPRLADDSPVNLEFISEMMECFKNQKMIHRRYAVRLVKEATALLKSYESLVDIPVPDGQKITVCGDVHGQYFDLCNIFELNGMPSQENPYLFNGDFVDRGSFSLEIMLTLLAHKLLYPNHFHLLRGNHETFNMNQVYGFKGEVEKKLTAQIFGLFTTLFNWLPLAATLSGAQCDKKVLILHGGLFSRDDVTLDDIRKVDRNGQPGDSGIFCEILWSDPDPVRLGRHPSKRGCGVMFGRDVAEAFFARNNIKLLVRSHEMKEQGYEEIWDRQLVTIFSAPNYCDQMGNKGAFIHFGPELEPKYTQFDPVPHPNIRPMAYANMGGMFGL